MQTEIIFRSSYAMANVTLAPNERIRAEAAAMVAMSAGVSMETRASGGLLSSLKHSLLGRESFFMNEYQASSQGGQINLAPTLPGDMMVLDLTEQDDLLVQSGSYVASGMDVNVDTKWGGARTFFASEGLFLLRCWGRGQLILSSYGGIHELQLDVGERYTVDTGHLVAFDQSLDFDVRTIGGLKSTLFSGEGLVVDLTGPGRALLQTRSTDALLSWLIPEVKSRLDSHGS